ncbi:Hypothetical protein GLP15_4967 [Giardia lamblia P15]|uniref:DNA replication complex GINS protein PSF1 C-terminal domain-containing protein n=1 Tax=Giardia intestinalis (strain P15) TaxID=658858 RepID=E1F7R0_GIAIA|nr:Hypothetical protein GLP15_4967 [Giardia lamblia P15]
MGDRSDRNDIAPLPGGAAIPVHTVNCQSALELLVDLRSQEGLPPYDSAKVAAAIKSLADIYPHLSYYLDLLSDSSKIDTTAILRHFYPFYTIYNESIHLLVVYHMTRFRRLLSTVNSLIDLPSNCAAALSPYEQELLKQIQDVRVNFYLREGILPTPKVAPPTSAYIDVMVVDDSVGEVLLQSGEIVFLDYGSFHHLLRSDAAEFLARGQLVILSE